MLPQDFLERMRWMLGEEYPSFLDSYDRERYQALRLNGLKTEKDLFLSRSSFHLTPVPWAEEGFYYGAEDAPGKHPYHEAGVYYIQEPSAMAPALYLMEGGPKSGGAARASVDWENERILDLCAAPGGKSTQIAAYMQGKGILVCNEIHPARAKILSENVERMGICNAMVTNETPRRLAAHFADYFTRILVDAPCSGEGMFRKNEEACGEWSLSNVELCASRQDEILDCAASMLAPGGRLVYSTCTFAPSENEGSIARFLARHPEFAVEEVPIAPGMSQGVPEWADTAGAQTKTERVEKAGESGTADLDLAAQESLACTIHLWPHRLDGEGHYLAVLRKVGELRADAPGYCRNGVESGIPERELNLPGRGILEFLEFAQENLHAFLTASNGRLHGRYLKFGDQLYLIPEGMPSVRELKVLRPGLHLGTVKKNRFEPSHALALALRPGETIHQVEFLAQSAEIRGYLNGGTFAHEGKKGWYLVTVDGYGIGWGKLAGGVLKNHYPKGLRKVLIGNIN